MARFILLLILSVTSSLSAQEIRRPTGRMAPGEADPCAACPAPDSFTCQAWPMACYQCWEDCGSPIATHTPTPLPTRTPTPPPPPTPTPNGPACELGLPNGGSVYLIAFYLHESEQRGVRYSYRTASISVSPGSLLRPCPCEGHPVGFEWHTADGRLLGSCGDTATEIEAIFEDGFETGNTKAWGVAVP